MSDTNSAEFSVEGFSLDEALKNVDPGSPLQDLTISLEETMTSPFEISYRTYPTREAAKAMTPAELKRYLLTPHVSLIDRSRP